MKEKEVDNYDDTESWDKHDFDVGGKKWAEGGDN